MYKYFNIKIECFSAKYTTYNKSMYTVCTNKYRTTNGFIRYMKSVSPGVLPLEFWYINMFNSTSSPRSLNHQTSSQRFLDRVIKTSVYFSTLLLFI